MNGKTQTIRSSVVYAAFLLLFSLTPSPLAGEPHLRITATLPSEVVCFHVVPVTLTIKNTDREETAVFPPPEIRLIGVTIANAATGQIEYEGPVAVSRSSVEREPPRPVQLPPGGEFKIPFILRCRWIADRPLEGIFERPEKYRVRISRPFRTDWVELTSKNPPGKEARALASLRMARNRGWLFEPQESTFMSEKEEQVKWESFLLVFVRKHPKSYWTPHAHVALAYLYVARALDWKNRPSPEMKAHWLAKAKRSLARVEGATANMSAGDVRTMLLNRETEKIAPKPVENIPQPPPPNPWIAAYKELHAEYYDTRRLSVGRAPWVKEMKRKETEILEKGMLGKMPLEEAQQQAGEVAKEYIRKHAKPLSKSEWNRRYKIYAEQEKARQARQRAEQMRDAPENARILREAIEKRRREQAKPK
jgi:hypothetical protein